jgi:hypothetical protein
LAEKQRQNRPWRISSGKKRNKPGDLPWKGLLNTNCGAPFIELLLPDVSILSLEAARKRSLFSAMLFSAMLSSELKSTSKSLSNTSCPSYPSGEPRWHAKAIMDFDYCLSSIIQLTRGILISFFDTEEVHAVMLAYPA